MEPRIPQSFELETERFLLRIPNESDIPFVFAATRFPGFNDGMMWDPPPNEKELLKPLRSNLKAWNDGKGYAFTIINKKTKERSGRISIRITETDDIWNVGFWTHPEYQGQGVMTEALSRVLTFGFNQLNAIRIEAGYAIWNKASQTVLERNGFKFIKNIKDGFQKNGQSVDEHNVAINRSEWSLP